MTPSARTALLAALAVLSPGAPLSASCPAPEVARLDFESPVSPNGIAVTPDGALVLAVNPPGNSISIFDANARRLIAEVAVGLQPVAIAVHPSGTFAYVANHVSDSLSVVDLERKAVVATIQELVPELDDEGLPRPDAGTTRFDEPADVVFSADGASAFVTLTQMNQVAVVDAVRHRVIDRIDLNGTLVTPGGERVFLEAPRALTVLGDDLLAVAAFASGNRTESRYEDGFPFFCGSADDVRRELVSRLRCLPGADVCRDNPYQISSSCGMFCTGQVAPPPLKVVEERRVPDRDLVVIRLSTRQPVALIGNVATLIYGLAAAPGPRPGTYRLLVAHTDARNQRNGLSELEGRPWLNRLSEVVFDPDLGFDAPVVHDLDAPEGSPVSPAEPAAVPYGVVHSAPGDAVYVTASGSGRLLVVDPDGTVRDRIAVGAHPTALALNPVRNEVYVLNRLDASISVIDAATRTVAATLPVASDPLPPDIRAGARLVHDASRSASGSFSCASCHPAGEADRLVWNLGPSGQPGEVGPRVTQTLRGVAGTERFHWDGKFATLQALVTGTVTGLMGGSIAAEEASAAADYLRGIPNLPGPARTPGDRLTPAARQGIATFFSHRGAGTKTCAAAGCHAMPHGASRAGQNRIEAPSLRGIYDRRPSFHNGAVLGLAVVECYDWFDDIYEGNLDWKVAARAALKTDFPELEPAEREGLLSWFEQMSNGLPGALGRQVTLTEASRSDPEARLAEQTIWSEVERGKLRLSADGLTRPSAGEAWSQAHLRWDAESRTFCGGAAGGMTRDEIESALAAGNAIVTYTAHLGTEAEDPPPEMHRAFRTGTYASSGTIPDLDPLGPYSLTVEGDGFGPATRLFTDGAIDPEARIGSEPTVETPGRMTVRVDDLSCCCGDVLVLQAQAPGGRASNEIPVRVSAGPDNDAGPDLAACEGRSVIIGLAGRPAVAYAWSPAQDLADPAQAVTVAAPPGPGVHLYTRRATIPATACESQAEVAVSVFPRGSVPLAGNGYRLTRVGAGIRHEWVEVPGTADTSLLASSEADRSAPSRRATLPAGTASWLELDALDDPAPRYYFAEPGVCR